MSEEQTYDLDLLSASQEKWKNSPGLRIVYADIYERIKERTVDGTILELGSGIGNGKEFIPSLVTSDIAKTPYVDQAISCYEIDEREAVWNNLIALDVLHHLRFPMQFFQSAAHVLSPGGRVVLAEPAATFGGRIFYTLFHHEPILPKLITPPFSFEPNGPNDEFANMGMGVGLFEFHAEKTRELLNSTGLTIHSINYYDLAAYPLSGGYSKPQLVPTCILRACLKAEQMLPQWFLRIFGLRMFITLEKK